MRLFLLTALTMTAFAANSVLNRAAVGGGNIGAVEFAVVRLVAGAGMLGILILLRRGRTGQAMWPGWRGRVAGAGALLVYLFGFSLAYGGLDAGTGALVLFGMVQITMFAGAFVSREAVPARRWIGAAVAFLGLAYLLSPGSEAAEHPTHAALMAAAGVGWGVYSLSARGTRDPLGATAWNFLLAVPVGGLALALLPGAAAPTAGAAGLFLAVVSGALTSGLGYALWYAVLPDLGAARGGVAQLTVPVIALAGGMAFLGEALTLRFVIASALVLGGVALATMPRRA
ncbi:MAG: DMT family transporter [Rhodobacteraceae bacterium]|jgi:drug/metabolite transporter (DMT)-like permease|uniref:DMT family transporter n=1 Tax=Albidovulum sp. TaxID=1872424 RepID=UPI001D88351B|nr:DMT family transporter [uncultured Defluviimonas sp.]MCB2126885.1 DMT family transporter [Paracoccaceae bacterium]MCC0069752.1 DMT family transporter [Paracoccaceae bacterium]